MADFDGASQALLAWLQRSRAEVNPKIQIADLRNAQAGRGVVATEDIAEHEVLFRIPRTSLLSVENSILSTEIPAATFEMLGPWLSLILVMLYEYLNGDASNWAPYFAVLPTAFNTLMFWSEDELAELQASAVATKIGKESAEEAFTEQLLPVIQEFADVFFSGDERAKQRAEEMRNARNVELMHNMGSLIMAYAFDVEPATPRKDVDDEGFAEEEEDEALPKAMVPLADMLNADADRNNARLFYENTFLDMKALKPIKGGEEIFNDYGPLPRSDLLRRYGYVTENYAQYDVAEIPMELVVEVTNSAGIFAGNEARLQYLEEQEITDSGYDITASSPFTIQESLSPELVILIETLLLPPEEFERLKSKGRLPKPEKITSQGAEVLHRLVQVRAAQYGTSLEQDLQSLKLVAPSTTNKAHRYAMAREVRIGEKKILKQAEEALAELIARVGISKRPRAVNDEDGDGDVEMGGVGKKARA
ncbi:hypothetical protein DE146DRAFT_179397 [Phaeosphaeria sp. MPI-PUGE-AT-0046c]|nr:hypothetical protein DE146DRAFT_179397 [Phaeosphaeria sp. MPI-PUGE-AT-0046c]